MEVDFSKALAGVTALAAAFAALATGTGAFEQMQRSEPQWSAAVFSTALLAGVLFVGAGLAGGFLEKIFVALALIAFTFAAVAGIVFLIQARGNRPTPSITAALKTTPRLVIAGSVKIGGMRPNETLKVSVLGEPPGAAADPNSHSEAEDRLFDARLGPDGSGAIDFPYDVPIPTKKYRFVRVAAWVAERPGSCFGPPDSVSTPGCIVIRLVEPDGVA
jgi:hypothetical protein